jgi:hypothetical protein
VVRNGTFPYNFLATWLLSRTEFRKTEAVVSRSAQKLIFVSETGHTVFYIFRMIQYNQRRARRPIASFSERQERKTLQEIQGRAAMSEYHRERQAVLERMVKLKKARQDRERESH